jgi:hypothetical protein
MLRILRPRWDTMPDPEDAREIIGGALARSLEGQRPT